MARAPYEEMFTIKGFENVTAGTIKWPMSVIRLQADSKEDIVSCAEHILKKWLAYSDGSAFIRAYSEDGTRHNAITPIARRTDDMRFEMDLVLRNNITTEEHPMGVFHPHEEYHHLKKENIGLIEVMGLAVLPARLKNEMTILANAIANGEDLTSNDMISKHAEWVAGWRGNYDLSTEEKIREAIRCEIGKAFAKILECAGVFKRDPDGMKAFMRFCDTLGV